tara:strand:+ start:293 stop:562 length:270 start_codon:yes stop_codon:yes gene_type:complete
MRKKLNQWANFGKTINILILIMFAFAFAFSIISCEDIRIGKTREEINKDLSRVMFEVDSILNHIQYQLDSTGVDGTFYLNAQRINNGSN